MKSIICNLDGYLLSLRRLSGNKCDFWANTFEIEGDLEKSLLNHLNEMPIEVSLGNKTTIGFSEIDEVLQKHIFSNISIKDENLLKLFAWDIVEFIDMTYRLLEPRINPISDGHALLFDATSEFHGDYVYMIIPVLQQAVIIGLATRA